MSISQAYYGKVELGNRGIDLAKLSEIASRLKLSAAERFLFANLALAYQAPDEAARHWSAAESGTRLRLSWLQGQASIPAALQAKGLPLATWGQVFKNPLGDLDRLTKVAEAFSVAPQFLLEGRDPPPEYVNYATVLAAVGEAQYLSPGEQAKLIPSQEREDEGRLMRERQATTRAPVRTPPGRRGTGGVAGSHQDREPAP